MPVKLVSSDLNGTLVHQHTMSDMIRLYVGEGQYRQVDAVFKRQTSGSATMEEAFNITGPLTRGLTLRQAIEYTTTEMRYINGFSDFVGALAERNIPFVINSTGYSVTIYAIKEQIGSDKVHGHIGNFLRFGLDADPAQALQEDELERMVRSYFADPEAGSDTSYDRIQATGAIDLGIIDEAAKAKLILEYVEKHFPGIQPHEIAHIGDTMGDSGGIVGIAEAGGIGIAFNYNEALENHLCARLAEPLVGQIHLIDHKSADSDLRRVLRHIG